MPKRPNPKKGSALLLTILITSLLMIIVLSYTVYVRMELRAVGNRIDLMRAKQNAKLSMHLALNKLQTAAGMDQRVTARADITGIGGGARFWTGVWENDGAGGVQNPVWLVSGENPDPNNPGGHAIFPGVNADPTVTVELEDIEDADGNTIGQFAYWVSDEGVKASVAARRHAVVTYEDGSLKADRRTVEYQSDFGVDLTPLFNSPSIDLTDTDLPLELERATFASDFILASDSSGSGLQGPSTDLPLHDITTVAYGVLENPQDGGLKKNLSDPTLRDSFVATDETAAFLAPKGGSLRVEYRDPEALGIQEGEPFFSPRPILTEAMLQVGLFWNDGDSQVRTRHHLKVELFNPYTLPIDLDTSRFGEVILLFENLPTLTISAQGLPTITKDMDTARNSYSSNPSKDEGYYSEVRVENRKLLPGEFYEEVGPTGKRDGLNRLINNRSWAKGTADVLQPRVTVKSNHGNDPLIIKLVHPSYTGTNRNAGVIQEITLERTDFPFKLDYDTDWSNFQKETSDYTINDYSFAYHYRLWSDDTDTASMRDLLTRIPILDPTINSSTTYQDLEGTNKAYKDLIIPYNKDTRLIQQNGLDEFDKQDLLRDDSAGGHTNEYHKIYLIDVPDGEDIISTGVLCSLPLYQKPPRSIGSPWGGDANGAFDRYYFSPKRLHPDTGAPMMVSPNLLYVDDPQDGEDPLSSTPTENDAENELLIGQFNINSTSVTAWEAVLSAPVLTPLALDEGGGSDLAARPATFISQPLNQAYEGNKNDFVVTVPELKDPNNAFSQGIRTLSDSNRIAQIQQMALNIVGALKTRGEPFPDLKNFLNSGLLQQAIDDITAANAGEAVNEGITEYSNLFLKQSDVAAKLAANASQRSDTFTIRAYGNIMNPATGTTISHALCEALVQRVPAKLNSSNPLTPAASLLDARRFKIVSFRWLSDADS